MLCLGDFPVKGKGKSVVHFIGKGRGHKKGFSESRILETLFGGVGGIDTEIEFAGIIQGRIEITDNLIKSIGT